MSFTSSFLNGRMKTRDNIDWSGDVELVLLVRNSLRQAITAKGDVISLLRDGARGFGYCPRAKGERLSELVSPLGPGQYIKAKIIF